MLTKEKHNYIAYADIARILAAFSVVLLHTGGVRLISVPIHSVQFLWAAFFDCITRWSVPLFVMLSGMLFLDKNKNIKIKTIYTKNILRMVTAFLFWSYIYNLYTAYASGNGIKESFVIALKNVHNGAFHLWFIFVIIGLYIVVPFVKRMTENMTKREAEYFIILSMLVTFVPKTLSSFEVFAPYLSYINKFEINYAAGYVGLFVAGWYINNFEHSKLFSGVVYALGYLGFAYMYLCTVYFSSVKGMVVDEFMSFKSISAFLMAMAVLLALKHACRGKTFKRKTLSTIAFYSRYTFGIYLVHEMFLNISSAKGWFVLESMPYIGIPIEAVIIFTLSLIVTGILAWLPLGKYIT